MSMIREKVPPIPPELLIFPEKVPPELPLRTGGDPKNFRASARLLLNKPFYIVFKVALSPEAANFCTFGSYSSVFTTKTTHFRRVS